jgi:hypothetical protein
MIINTAVMFVKNKFQTKGKRDRVKIIVWFGIRHWPLAVGFWLLAEETGWQVIR